MAAVARARNPGLATMTRSQKVDIIKQNLQGTLQTLNGRLERLGPNDSTSRAVLQQAKAKVEESIQKMNTLPEGEVLNQLKEGNPECTNVITTLDQAMAASQEVSHLLTA
ncbi:MAG: hypothetical protein LBD54_00260 [Puniceicoccales bacterium]|jgi:tryptophanyl-tRNA synthetase|nr:hypothetical protein [Puniceicoccales bacterium]